MNPSWNNDPLSFSKAELYRVFQIHLQKKQNQINIYRQELVKNRLSQLFCKPSLLYLEEIEDRQNQKIRYKKKQFTTTFETS